MRRALHALLALALAFAPPAAAQSIFFPATGGGGGGGTADLNYTAEVTNLAGGAGTEIPAHGTTAHSLGVWTSLGTTSQACAGFSLDFFSPSSAGARNMVSLSTDTGSSSFLAELWVQQGNSSLGTNRIDVPYALGNGATVHAAMRSSVAGSNIRAALTCWISQGAGNPAGFTTIDNLTTPTTVSTQLSASANLTTSDTAFTTLVADTGANPYKALLFSWYTNSNPGTTQPVIFRFAIGAESSEVVVGAYAYPVFTSQASNGRGALLVYTDVPANARISVNARAATGGDALVFGVKGFR